MAAPEARLPRTFWFLFAGALLNRIGSFVVPLFSIYLTLERGLSPTTTGWITAMYGLGSLASGPVGGSLADRLGRRPTLVLGFVWGAVAMLIVPYARSTTEIALASLHLGLANDLYRPAMQAAVADLCPPELRVRAYGTLYWAVNLGFAIAAVLGGALARYGFARMFVIDAATTLGFAALVLLFVPETRPRGAARAAERQGTWGEALSDGTMLATMGTQCLVLMLFGQMAGALPVSLGRAGLGPEQYGRVIAVNGVLIVILQPVAMALVARMRRTRALALAAALVGVGFGWNALPLGVAGAVTSVAIWTLGEILLSPVMPSLLSDLAPTHLRGRYQGMLQMAWGVSTFLGQPAGMWLFEHRGPTTLWLACLGSGLTAAALHLQSAGRLRARLGDKGRPA